MTALQVYDEIGPIERVLVHRPGQETRRFPHGEFALAFPLRPSSSDFNLAQAQAEHDALTAILRNAGAEVVELRDLLLETLEACPESKTAIIVDFLGSCRIEGEELTAAAARYLQDAPDDGQFATRLFEGIRYGDTELACTSRHPLASMTESAFDPDTFLSSPLNTAFFTRDPASVVGEGVSANHMYWHDRNREALILRAIFEHHPDFAGAPQWFSPSSSFHLEGGDIVNLTERAVAVGWSSRTESLAIDRLCQGLLWGEIASPVTDLYVFEVPQSGNRLHLDAYLSRIDYDTFAADPLLSRSPRAYHLRRGRQRGSVRIDPCEKGLAAILGEALGDGPVRLMDFGAEPSSRLDFEYGNGAAGVLALAPGNLCVCAENLAANERLADAGMTLHPVSIQEMTAGFGGPNSLCLPLRRAKL